MKKHKYHNKTGRVLDTGVTQCVKCGIIREFLKGKAYYFSPREDCMLHYRPECNPDIKKHFI